MVGVAAKDAVGMVAGAFAEGQAGCIGGPFIISPKS